MNPTGSLRYYVEIEIDVKVIYHFSATYNSDRNLHYKVWYKFLVEGVGKKNHTHKKRK